MAIDDIKTYAYLASAALSIGAMLYAWLSARGKANASAISELDGQLGEHNVRLVRIEGALETLPELRQELGRVHQRVDDVAAVTHKIDGQLGGIDRNVELITVELVKKGREGRAAT